MDVSTLPSDEEITSAVWEILKSNMDISRNEIKSQLEAKHNWDLSDSKAVLKAATASYIEGLEEELTAPAEEEAGGTPKKKGGFSAPVQLSTELSEFLGEVTLPRTDVTKRIWVYIKEHDLQNPQDRREILCDAQLEKLFGRKKIMMFKMTKVLSQHMKSVDSLQDAKPAAAVKKEKKTVKKAVSAASSASSTKSKKATSSKTGKVAKKSNSGGGGFGAPVQLSAGLAALLGHDVLPRTEVTKKIWEYIKERDLQNPENRKEIICDVKLEELFGVKSIDMFKLTSKVSENLVSTGEPSATKKRKAEDGAEAETDTKKKKKKGEIGEKKTGGFGGAVVLSEPLARVLNAQNGAVLEEWPRTEVVRVMWNYIKENNLQNPENKREILLDSALEKVFKTKSFTMFQMNTFLKDHMTKAVVEEA